MARERSIALLLFCIPVVAAQCDFEDFSISYSGSPVFLVSRQNRTCLCPSYATTALTSVSTTTQNLTVTGPASFGPDTLTVTPTAVTVRTGATVDIGTAGTSTAVNVRATSTFAGPVAFSSGAVTVANGQTLNVGTAGTSAALNAYATSNFYGPVTVANGQTVNIGTSGNSAALNVFGSAVISGSLTLGSSSTLTAPGSSTFGTLSATTLTAQNVGPNGLGAVAQCTRTGTVDQRVVASVSSSSCSVYLFETLTVTVPASYTSGLRYRIVWHETSNSNVNMHYYTFLASSSVACSASAWRVSPYAYSYGMAGIWRSTHGEFVYTFPPGTTVLYMHVATDGGATAITFANNGGGDRGFTYCFAMPA